MTVDLTIVSTLSPAGFAHLTRCAWQRQQGMLDPARANREFATVALWTSRSSGIGLREVGPPIGVGAAQINRGSRSGRTTRRGISGSPAWGASDAQGPPGAQW